jgi:hypothetical protein
LGEDLAEVPAELFVVPEEGPQDALPAHGVGLLEAYGAQVEGPQGELPDHEAELLGVFEGPGVTEP